MQVRNEGAPGAHLSAADHRLAAFWIVEIEQTRLVECVGAAQAERVIRVSFHLNRAAFPAPQQQTGGKSAESHGSREKQGLAGCHFVRLHQMRHDLLDGLALSAASPTSERNGRSHEFYKVTAAHRVEPFTGL